MTNADKIRSMSDTELTAFIDHITVACYCCAQDRANGMSVTDRKPHCVFDKCVSKTELEYWLKQESK